MFTFIYKVVPPAIDPYGTAAEADLHDALVIITGVVALAVDFDVAVWTKNKSINLPSATKYTKNNAKER